MKYELHWVENHLCYNDKEIKDWEDSLPNAVCDGGSGDCVYDFACKDIIEAESDEEAIKKIEEYDCWGEVFILMRDGKRIFDDTYLDKYNLEGEKNEKTN